MMALWRLRTLLSWRWLLGNKLQLLLALTGIVTGVAAVIAVDAARQAVNSSFASNRLALQGRASHQITAIDDQAISLEQYVRLRQQLADLPLAPLTSFRLRHVDGDLLQMQAVDLISDLQWSRRDTAGASSDADTVVAQIAESDMANWLAGEPLVLVSADLLERVADGQLLIESPRSQPGVPVVLSLQVVGSLASHSSSPASVYMDQALAARLRGSDSVDLVRLLLTGEQAQSLPERLPPGLQLKPVDSGDNGMAAAFGLNLQAMGLLALLMGVLLVYSTFRLLILQREPLHQLRYRLGESQAQHWLETLVEALVLGLIGSLLGLVAGLLLAELVLSWLQQTLAELFSRGGFGWNAPAWRTVALALLTGVGSSLLAILPMLWRWWRSHKQTVPQPSRQRSQLRLWIAFALLLSAVLLLQLMSGLVAALAALFAVTLAWLLLSQRLLMLLAGMLHAGSSMRKPLLALASARLREAIPKMTPALAALILALATLVGVSSMISSFRGSVIDWLEITLSAPVYMSNGGAAMPPGLQQQIDALPMVQTTGWLHALPALINDPTTASTQLVLLDLPEQGQQSYRMLAGQSLWSEAFDAHSAAAARSAQAVAVMVGETLARRQQLNVDDVLQITVAGHQRQVLIVGIYQDYSAGGGRLIAKRADWLQAPQQPTSLAVYLAETEVPAFRQWLNRQLDPASAVSMISATRVKSETLRIFDQTFLLTRALRWILALVAMVGVSGALLALQLERQQELRLLHQLGLSGWEQQRLILFEALFLALLAMLLALPLGYLLGWMLTEIINLRAFGWHIDLTVLSAHWMLMIAVGLLAGLLAAAIAMLVNQRSLQDQQPKALPSAALLT